MAVTLKDDFVKEQKQWVKRAMKGRALYFGLQAQAAKKGKFVVSKKPGEVKAAKVKELQLYEGSGKDKAKAEEKNKVPGGASMGVCQGANGTLKLYFERGKVAPVAEKFVKYFVTREVKFKLVKKVQIAEVDQLPAVPEQDAGDSEQVTAQSVEARVKELAQRSKAAGGDGYGLPDRLKQALALASSNAGQADDALDEIEFVIGTLERAKGLQDDLKTIAGQPGVAKEPVAAIAKRIAEALNLVKSENVDGADDALDVAEQSMANLRQAAGLPEAGTATQEPPKVSKVDDAQAEAFFKDWLEGIKPDLKTLKDAKAAEFPEIAEHVKGVNDAVKSKDWTGAAAAYKKADALISTALTRIRTAESASLVSSGIVDYARARLEWDNARKVAFAELEKLEDAILNATKYETFADELRGKTQARLYQTLTRIDNDLSDHLDQALSASDTEQRQQLHEVCRRDIARYRELIGSDPMLADVDSNNGFVSVNVRSTLDGTLAKLSSVLK